MYIINKASRKYINILTSPPKHLFFVKKVMHRLVFLVFFMSHTHIQKYKRKERDYQLTVFFFLFLSLSFYRMLTYSFFLPTQTAFSSYAITRQSRKHTIERENVKLWRYMQAKTTVIHSWVYFERMKKKTKKWIRYHFFFFF